MGVSGKRQVPPNIIIQRIVTHESPRRHRRWWQREFKACLVSDAGAADDYDLSVVWGSLIFLGRHQLLFGKTTMRAPVTASAATTAAAAIVTTVS